MAEKKDTVKRESLDQKQTVVIQAEAQILGSNAIYAQKVRDLLKRKHIYCVNLISSPGSGKTTLLVETLKQINQEIPCAVIEGDQRTSNDALRIKETGVPVVQVNTLQSCHLNASQILESIHHLPVDIIKLLIIENVGNLVCPAGMDLGENEKIVLMSVTEGEDKPIKYPLAFSSAQALIITKIDLIPYLRFDLPLSKKYAKSVNDKIEIIETSSYTKIGFLKWMDYLRKKAGTIIADEI